MVYYKKCKKGVGSIISWKPRLHNYKVLSRRTFVLARWQLILLMNVVIRKYLYLAFFIIDVVNNTSGLTCNQIEDLILEKEIFWVGTLVRQHQGLNSTHDWNRSHQTEREKINN